MPKQNSSTAKLDIRIGYGWDSHEFKSGIPLKIGGVTLPYKKGLGGHSDGDVLLHAITDALLARSPLPTLARSFHPPTRNGKARTPLYFLRRH